MITRYLFVNEESIILLVLVLHQDHASYVQLLNVAQFDIVPGVLWLKTKPEIWSFRGQLISKGPFHFEAN